MLAGTIVKGRQLGRQLGFPTANVASLEQLIPKKGVYCGFFYFSGKNVSHPEILKIPEKSYPAVINIGYKPTVINSSGEISVEVHILDENFAPDYLYEKSAFIYFCHYMRNEFKFSSLQDLKKQILYDTKRARKILSGK